MSITRNDVARLAGVSSTTVSYVINNGPRPVSSETRKKVLAAVETLGYHPSSIARSLKTKRTTTIGVVVSDILNPVLSTIAKKIEDILLEYGCNIILCNSDENPERELRFLKMLVSKQVDGILLQSTGGNLIYLEHLVVNLKIPFVLMDREIRHLPADCILFENESGAYQATRHLIEAGHRRIALLSLPRHLTPGYERVNGYIRALRDADLPVYPELITEGGFKADELKLGETFLHEGESPTALLVCSNGLCSGFLRYAKEHRIRIPEELALAVFDDVPHYAYFNPSITSVAEDLDAFGREAGNLLMSRINRNQEREPQTVRIACSLVVRESTAGGVQAAILSSRLQTEGG